MSSCFCGELHDVISLTLPQKDRKVAVLVETVFRGLKSPEPVYMNGSTYKADFELIPKAQEHLYVESNVPPPPKKILPRTMDFPPLFSQILIRQMKAKGITEPEQLKLTIQYNITNMELKNYKIAEEGETPTVQIQCEIDKSSLFYVETEAAKSS